MKVALIQMNSQADKAANLKMAADFITAAAEAERPDLISLPENFVYLGGSPQEKHATADPFPNGPAFRAMADLARRCRVILHAGSCVEKDGDHYYNTTAVFGPDGEALARYRKIHLFDVVVPGGIRYLESQSINRGSDVVTYRAGDFTVGCSICYDIRFPELYRKLRTAGADIILIPAAFTLQTGKDHWEVLVRARAIEAQCYVLAPAQVGTHASGKKACWGHSMVVDPWGQIIAQASDRVGYITATLDKQYVTEIRQNLPVADHHVFA